MHRADLLPDKVSLDHWKFVLGIPYQEVVNPATGETRTVKAETPPLLWFWNSIKVSVIASAGIIFLSGTAAYAFARLRFKFRSTTLSALLILQMFPMVLSLVAFYVILDFAGQYVKWLGLNTQAGLIMIYLGGISNYIWMIKGYFETIPAKHGGVGQNRWCFSVPDLYPYTPSDESADFCSCIYSLIHFLYVRVPSGIRCSSVQR